MARLSLDANVLFSAAYRSETGLLELWKLREVVFCSSRYALEEARINLNHKVQRTRLVRLVCGDSGASGETATLAQQNFIFHSFSN